MLLFKTSRQFVKNVYFNVPVSFMHGVHFGFYPFYFRPLAKQEIITLSLKSNESAHSRHIL